MHRDPVFLVVPRHFKLCGDGRRGKNGPVFRIFESTWEWIQCPELLGRVGWYLLLRLSFPVGSLPFIGSIVRKGPVALSGVRILTTSRCGWCSAIARCKLICAISSTWLSEFQRRAPAAPECRRTFRFAHWKPDLRHPRKNRKSLFTPRRRGASPTKKSAQLSHHPLGGAPAGFAAASAPSTHMGALIFATQDHPSYTKIEASLDCDVPSVGVAHAASSSIRNKASCFGALLPEQVYSLLPRTIRKCMPN